jgi:hypothetical protein
MSRLEETALSQFHARLNSEDSISGCPRQFLKALKPFGIITFACGEIDTAAEQRAVFFAVEWPEKWRNFYYTMRARRGDRGLYPNFHAVLFAVREEAKEAGWGERVYERFNWSYRQLRFLPISDQGHATLGDAPECVPVPGFALALPFLRMRVR